MKQTKPAIVPAVLSALALMLIVAALLLPGRLWAASSAQVVNVDYVIALLDAGVDQAKVIDRIEQKGLTFRLAPGDMARLRSAGANDKLIEAVVDHAAVLEGHGSPGATAGQEQPPAAQDTDHWGRPSRLGRSGTTGSGDAPATPNQEQGSPPADDEQQQYQQQSEDGQGIDEEPYGGSYGYYYPGYYSGYYDFYYGYPYPYYYSYPYGAYYYYSYPYYHYYPRRHFSGGFGRGGGGMRTVPRGGHWTTPHSGGGSHSTPRSSPRGSHH